MRKLTDVPSSELKARLEAADDAKAAKRLVVALAYKDDIAVETLSERYGIPQSTIYYWIDRIENESLDQALVDDSRPGRPSKLSREQRLTIEQWIAASPREQGKEADEWTPELLRDLINEEFGVEYSRGHVRRILREHF